MNSHRLLSGGLIATCLAGATLAACGGSEETDSERAGQTVEGGAATGAKPGEAGGGSQSSKRSTSGDQTLSQSQSSSGQSQSQSGGGSQSSTQSQSCQGGDCSSSSRTSGASSVRTFSGTGTQTLTFNVEEPSVLSFTAAGGRFTVRGAGIAIDEPGGEGRTELAPGDYRDVRVAGDSWTIVIRPR